MKIVYNPADGAPIKGFVFQGLELDPHFPDGYEFRNSSGVSEVSNGLAQYEDATADEILETYQFLQEFTPEQAKALLERPADEEYKCDFPGCEFSTKHKVALSGHKRKHANETPGSEPLADPAIPVAGGRQVRSRPTVGSDRPGLSPEEVDTQNGIDKDGVEWYGEGVKEEKPADFGQTKSVGKGHFQG